MAPPAVGAARRVASRPEPRGHPAADHREPPLRLFEPAPRRRVTGRRFRRSSMWISVALVVGALLAVVLGDALVTEDQVRLSANETKVAAAVALQKSLQVAVAQKAAPPVVVRQAEAQGLVAPAQVVYLPRVALDVPLPPPVLTPTPASPAVLTPTPASSPTPALSPTVDTAAPPPAAAGGR